MATNHDGQSRDDKLERWLERVYARHLWVAAVPGATLHAYLIIWRRSISPCFQNRSGGLGPGDLLTA
jgi:hypothetical protein